MSDYFPSEIWVEILHRLPPKSLVICTCVCKSWKSLITNHAFTHDLLTRNLEAIHGNSSLFLQSHNAITRQDEFHSLSLHNHQIDCLSMSKVPPIPFFLKNYFYRVVIGTCNGLVCIADHSICNSAALTISIWNPSIRRYLLLPKLPATFKVPQQFLIMFGFGYDSRNKDFKVVGIMSIDRKHDSPPPQVFVCSLASASWKSFTGRLPQFHRSMVWRSQIFMNGVLHWVVNRTTDNGGKYNFILTFDLSEETFGELMLPRCFRETHHPDVQILEGNDLLTVLLQQFSDGHFFCVWVMKEYAVVESWTQVARIDSRSCGIIIYNLLAYTSNGEVFVLSRDDVIKILDTKKEVVKDLGKRLRVKCFSTFVGRHVDSLFLMDKKFDAIAY